MSRFRQQPRSPIGLDLRTRRIKAVQLEPAPESASGWRIGAATTVHRADAGKPLTVEEIALLADTLDRLGFVGNRVVLSAPSEKLITGMLELPKAAGPVSLEQIARIELARTNKVGPDTFEMGSWELPTPARAGKAVHIMAVGYPHADASQLLDLVESGGLDVVALDVRSCALTRACAGILAPPPAITALLDLGWASASLVLTYQGTIVYVRSLAEAGINRVYEGMSSKLRLEAELVEYLMAEVGLREAPAAEGQTNAEEAERPSMPREARTLLAGYADSLVRELLASFSYVARQYSDASVTRLLLMGTGAAVPALGDYLSKELGLETQSVAPRDLTECPPNLLDACSSPELTPAVGLAQFPET